MQDNSWLIFVNSLIFYLLYRTVTKREDEYLEEKFGGAYREYRKKVVFRFLRQGSIRN